MNIIIFVAIFMILKFVVTWLAIMSLVALFSPSTGWKMRVLWDKLRGKIDRIPEQPPTWNRRIRAGSLVTLPICLVLLIFFADSLLSVFA